MSPSEIRRETLRRLREAKGGMLSLEFQLNLEKEPADVRRQAALAISNTEIGILKLRTAELADIREDLLANEEELNKSADSLGKALANINKVKEVIGAAAAFLGVVGKVVKLL